MAKKQKKNEAVVEEQVEVQAEVEVEVPTGEDFHTVRLAFVEAMFGENGFKAQTDANKALAMLPDLEGMVQQMEDISIAAGGKWSNWLKKAHRNLANAQRNATFVKLAKEKAKATAKQEKAEAKEEAKAS